MAAGCIGRRLLVNRFRCNFPLSGFARGRCIASQGIASMQTKVAALANICRLKSVDELNRNGDQHHGYGKTHCLEEGVIALELNANRQSE